MCLADTLSDRVGRIGVSDRLYSSDEREFVNVRYFFHREELKNVDEAGVNSG